MADIHKYRFNGVDVPWKRRLLKDDPDWIEIAPGKWKRNPKKRRKVRDEREAGNVKERNRHT